MTEKRPVPRRATGGVSNVEIEEEASVVASNSVYSFLRSASKFVLSFLVSVFFVRFLGPVNYGVYSIVIIYWGVFLSIASLGFGSTVRYAIAKYRAKSDGGRIRWVAEHYLLLTVAASLAGGAVMFLIASPLASAYHSPVIKPLIEILALGLVFYSISENFASNAYVGLQKMKYAFWTGMLFDALRIGQFVLLFYGFGLIGIISFYDVIYAVSATAGVFLIFKTVRRSKPKKIAPPDRNELGKYSVFSWTSGLVTMVYGPVISLFLGLVAPNVAYVGYYRVGLLMSGVVGMPAAALGSAFFSTITKYYERKEHENFHKMSGVLIRYATLVTVPLVFGGIVAANQIVRYIYRAAFLGAEAPLAILLVSVLIGSVFGPVMLTLSAIGKQKYFFYSSVFGAVTGIILTVAIVPTLLAEGAALVYLGVNLVMITTSILFASKYVKIRIPVAAMAKILVCGGIMSGVLYMALRSVTRLSLLPLILIGGLVFYAVLAYLFNAINNRDIVFILRMTKTEKFVRKLLNR